MIKLTENAKRIFKNLYSFNDETIEDTFKRVANEFGEYKDIAYEYQEKNIWRPNTPMYLNAGNDKKIFSACYVISLDDSMDDIYDKANISRKIFQFGSGVGIPIGNLREKGALIFERKNDINVDARSSGPVTFMKLYDSVGETTKSGGRIRRAAILCSMPINHPDILEFIRCKEKDGKFSNMNISVCITDDFMDKLESNENFDVITPYNGNVIRKNDSNIVWNEICKYAHKTADPGILFYDTINEMNIIKKDFLIQTSNPCLVGDTLIKTDKGMVKMKELVKNFSNYRILTFNTDELRTEFADIVNGFLTKKDAEIYELCLQNNTILKLTGDHKVWTVDEGYVEAKKLKPEFTVLLNSYSENSFYPVNIKYVKKLEKKQDVYDIKVNKNSNFFANGILVHNCGEQVLPPMMSCNLSNINIYKFINDNNKFEFNKLYEVSYNIMKMMDYIIDKMDQPDERFKENVVKYRPVGIGLMGLSDTLFKLNIKYDSKEGRDFAENVMKTITTAAFECSSDLAKEIGTFFEYEKFKDDAEQIISKLIDDEKVLEKIKENGIRNFTVTTCPPTGTTAISCDASYGIEPCFGLVFKKNLIDGSKMMFVNPVFQEYENEPWFTNDLLEKISENNGSLKGIKGIPKEIRDIFVTAHNIKYKDRIDMQASIQNRCSSAISSTLNLPKETTVKEVSEIYKYAHKKKLKGITIYRDGCKENQPVSFTNKEKSDIDRIIDASEIQGLDMKRYFVNTGNGKLRLKVGIYNEKPVEIELTMGKGGQMSALTEALGRVMSISLQRGVPVNDIIQTMIGINSDRPAWFKIDPKDERAAQILSIPDGVAQVLERYYGNMKPISYSEEVCSNCGSGNVILVEGCLSCLDCNYSKCS